MVPVSNSRIDLGLCYLNNSETTINGAKDKTRQIFDTWRGTFDNKFVQFCWRVFQQTIGILIGTNCVPLLADFFLRAYEADLFQELLKQLAQTFNSSFCHINDVLSLNNYRFADYLHIIYPKELEVKDTAETQKSASYLDLHIEIDNRWRLKTKLYNKSDDFTFPIVNFPFINSNISE